jgi:hypothetical protein
MLCEPCSYCDGKGYLLSEESVAQKVLREIKKDLPRFCGRRIAVSVNRRVAERLLGMEKETLEALEQELGREIEIRARSEMHQEQFEITALDEGAAVPLDFPWLSGKVEEKEQPPAAEKTDEDPATAAAEEADEASATPTAEEAGEASATSSEEKSDEARAASAELKPEEPSSAEAEVAEVGLAAEPPATTPEPAGISPVEGEPALAAPSRSLDDPAESPIIQRFREREEP